MFKVKREYMIAFVKTTDQNLRNHFGKHLAFGTIDAYQWILIVAAHCERHTLQSTKLSLGVLFQKNNNNLSVLL
jgi:hypothetical protein